MRYSPFFPPLSLSLSLSVSFSLACPAARSNRQQTLGKSSQKVERKGRGEFSARGGRRCYRRRRTLLDIHHHHHLRDIAVMMMLKMIIVIIIAGFFGDRQKQRRKTPPSRLASACIRSTFSVAASFCFAFLSPRNTLPRKCLRIPSHIRVLKRSSYWCCKTPLPPPLPLLV